MRLDAVVMTVEVVAMAVSPAVPMMVVTVVGVGGVLRQPAADIGDFSPGLKKPDIEDFGRIDPSAGDLDDRFSRAQAVQLRAHRGEIVRRGDIRFGEQDAVGDRGLLQRFPMRLQRSRAIDGIDRGDHAFQPPSAGYRRVRHDGMENRRRIGQPGGLDDDAPERGNLAAQYPRPWSVKQ